MDGEDGEDHASWLVGRIGRGMTFGRRESGTLGVYSSPPVIKLLDYYTYDKPYMSIYTLKIDTVPLYADSFYIYM